MPPRAGGSSRRECRTEVRGSSHSVVREKKGRVRARVRIASATGRVACEQQPIIHRQNTIGDATQAKHVVRNDYGRAAVVARVSHELVDNGESIVIETVVGLIE